MATGSQPAVEGTSSGTTEAVPAVPIDGTAPPRPSNGAQPAARASGDGASGDGASGGPPIIRSSGSPMPSPPLRRAAPPPPLPVGRAAPFNPRRRPVRPVAEPPPRRSSATATAKRTRRVVRRIDVWTVLKMSILFYLCVFLVFMIAGIVLWNIAQTFNVIHSVEKFIRSIFDLQKFTFRPGVVLQSAAAGGGVLVLLATGANVLAALLYNLISDVVGGVQFIVLEESKPTE